MPGTDDVVLSGSPMLKHLGIDVYEAVGERARVGNINRVVTGVDSCNVIAARRVPPTVECSQAGVSQFCGKKWAFIG